MYGVLHILEFIVTIYSHTSSIKNKKMLEMN